MANRKIKETDENKMGNQFTCRKQTVERNGQMKDNMRQERKILSTGKKGILK